jgi:hypothetical protein
MAKEQIERTLIVLDEDEVRLVLRLAQQHDIDIIYEFMRDVIAQKVETALRMRCG